jgi:hypothetical protein
MDIPKSWKSEIEPLLALRPRAFARAIKHEVNPLFMEALRDACSLGFPAHRRLVNLWLWRYKAAADYAAIRARRNARRAEWKSRKAAVTSFAVTI